MLRQLIAFYPGTKFPAISVTGTRCELQCDHCRGHYLKGMKPALTPEELEEVALKLQGEGANGFLLSGGCDKQGRVPLDSYIASISWIKGNTNLAINAHTGFLNEAEALQLVKAGVDCFSIDVVEDERLMREVLHLDAGMEAYRTTLDALTKAEAKRVVPHVCVGLSNKEGETKVLDLLSQFEIDSLIVLVHMPTKGTPMEKKESPSNSRVEDFVERAIKQLNRPVVLGCMRPRGNWTLEVKCIELGVAGIALPSPRTIQWAREKGIEIIKKEECCAFHL